MSAHEPRLFAEMSETNPDEDLDIWMDGEIIMTVTYDDVGYPGLERIKQLVDTISELM